MSLFTGGLALATAIGAGTATVVGEKLKANAAQHGSDTQAAAAQEALDFTKAQKAKQEAAYAPYAAVGQQAASTLPGLVRPAPVGGPPLPFASQPRPSGPSMQGSPLSMMGQGMPNQTIGGGLSWAAGGTPAPSGQPAPQGAQMVLLQAPDGTQKQVPANQAQFYISRGAKQVGA